jgi:hypothetical protein
MMDAEGVGYPRYLKVRETDGGKGFAPSCMGTWRSVEDLVVVVSVDKGFRNEHERRLGIGIRESAERERHAPLAISCPTPPPSRAGCSLCRIVVCGA